MIHHIKNWYVTLGFIIYISATKIFSQDIKLTVDNPYPRINQSVSFNIQLDFLRDLLTDKMDQHFTIIDGISAPYSIIMTTKDTGEFVIGPFDITINNKKLKTDSIKIRVQQALLPMDSIYISTYTNNSKQYIVIEQVYEMIFKEGQNYNANRPKLVEINNKNYNSIIFSEKSGFDDLFHSKSNKPLHYSYKLYEITKYIKGEIILTNDNFDNLPAGFVLPMIKIKK